MDNAPVKKYSIQLGFEEIRLPPFDDILILGRKCKQGKIGVNKSFDYLVPNEFELFELDDINIEAVFINKHVLKKLDASKILTVLQEKVFPFVSDNEILKVDFKVKIFYDRFEGDY
jgi:hypothetical protein